MMIARTLVYHDLTGDGAPTPSGFTDAWAELYKLSVDRFDSHVEALAAHLSADEVTLVERADWSRPHVFLTFDDGGASSLQAAERITRRGWRGHFFITTDRIGTAGFLDAAGIRELHAMGHAIGSHSCSHPVRMAALTRSDIDREWRDSVARLSDILGAAIRTASVPGGHYADAVAQSAAASGIRFLFHSEPVDRVAQVDGCLVLGRYLIQRNTSARTAAALALGEWWPCTSQRLWWTTKKTAKLTGPLYLAVGRFVNRFRHRTAA